jgi:hypothetical protein
MALQAAQGRWPSAQKLMTDAKVTGTPVIEI